MKKLYKSLRPQAAAILESGKRCFVFRRAGFPRRAENYKVAFDTFALEASGWVYQGETFNGETY